MKKELYQCIIVLCARRRRPVFDLDGTKPAFLSALKEACFSNQIGVVDVYLSGCVAIMCLSLPPALSADSAAGIIRRTTSRYLMKVIPALSAANHIWLRDYLFLSSVKIDRDVKDAANRFALTKPKR